MVYVSLSKKFLIFQSSLGPDQDLVTLLVLVLDIESPNPIGSFERDEQTFILYDLESVRDITFSRRYASKRRSDDLHVVLNNLHVY